ncbi:hypothetical protein ScalyP_jg4060, partial [Parmales sp. scaly parma]
MLAPELLRLWARTLTPDASVGYTLRRSIRRAMALATIEESDDDDDEDEDDEFKAVGDFNPNDDEHMLGPDDDDNQMLGPDNDDAVYNDDIEKAIAASLLSNTGNSGHDSEWIKDNLNTSFGLQRLLQPPDGNCLFHCIAHVVLSVLCDESLSLDTEHLIVREGIVDYIYEHWEEFASFFLSVRKKGKKTEAQESEEAREFYENKEAYKTAMMKPEEWGGHAEMVAFEAVSDYFFKIYIVTVTSDGQLEMTDLDGAVVSPDNVPNGDKKIILFHAGGTHYDLCVSTAATDAAVDEEDAGYEDAFAGSEEDSEEEEGEKEKEKEKEEEKEREKEREREREREKEASKKEARERGLDNIVSVDMSKDGRMSVADLDTMIKEIALMTGNNEFRTAILDLLKKLKIERNKLS